MVRLKVKKCILLASTFISIAIVITIINLYLHHNELLWNNLLPNKKIIRNENLLVGDIKKDESMLRVVHLDLKGAPPKLMYLRQLLPLLAEAGCNTLLVEYEDMFPYHGSLANISAKNAYTSHQLLDLLSWCNELDIEVIPLVQTFGHLEFVLKLEEFRHLRESDVFPQELCPSNLESMVLIEEMLRQVMSLHRSSKYIHIGCDEVFHLAMCKKCTQRRLDSREIFAKHVADVAIFIRTTYPGVTPLIWDDMMRQWNPQFLSSSPLGELVEPVVWVYTDNIQKLIPHYVWHWYSKTFKNIWIAGAFKGATLSTSVLPNTINHFENQRSWLNFILKSKTKIKGYVLTGWSRYDHFAILCELLPPSIPSLVLNLVTITLKNPIPLQQLLKKWAYLMKCSSNLEIQIESFTNLNPNILRSCSFSGLDSYVLMQNYLNLKTRIDWLNTYLTERRAWMTFYNVKHNFSTSMRIIEGFTEANGINILREIEMLKNDSSIILSQYFDKYTTNEWIEQRIEPLENILSDLLKKMETLLSIKTWQRRPL